MLQVTTREIPADNIFLTPQKNAPKMVHLWFFLFLKTTVSNNKFCHYFVSYFGVTVKTCIRIVDVLSDSELRAMKRYFALVNPMHIHSYSKYALICK